MDYPLIRSAVNGAVPPPSGRGRKRRQRRAAAAEEFEHKAQGCFLHSPVDVICVSPAPVRVRVPVSSVDEGVFERAADVLRGQTGHRRHHVARELADPQRPSVLASPPVMFCPEPITHNHLRTRVPESCRDTRDSTRLWILSHCLIWVIGPIRGSLHQTGISWSRTVITVMTRNAKNPCQ